MRNDGVCFVVCWLGGVFAVFGSFRCVRAAVAGDYHASVLFFGSNHRCFKQIKNMRQRLLKRTLLIYQRIILRRIPPPEVFELDFFLARFPLNRQLFNIS